MSSTDAGGWGRFRHVLDGSAVDVDEEAFDANSVRGATRDSELRGQQHEGVMLDSPPS